MPRPSRRALLAGAAGTAVVGVAGCSAADLVVPAADPTPEPPTVVPRAPSASASLAGDAADLAAAMTGALLERSRVALLAADAGETVEAATLLARSGRWPVLVGSPGSLAEPTLAELRRLGVEHVVLLGDAVSREAAQSDLRAEPGLEDVTVAVAPLPTAATSTGPPPLPQDVPVGEVADDDAPAVVVAASGAASWAALATAAALGARTHTDVVDPRETPEVMAALRETPRTPLLALGDDEAAARLLLVQGTMAQRAPELPGGGVTVFPHRRMVALYGHPGAPVLGLLGEQGVEASIERVGEYVERYAALVSEPVVPAFEIIASVATGSPGPDEQYSKVWPPETFRAWVDAAREAGVYVVLDLQPGRTDFLTQAKAYEELLLEPHVGLALDPEWRLGPNERHLVRIGSVEAAEVNAVSDWLAGLVRTHDLPQKVLTLHQFRLSMIRGRESVRTDHPEVAVVLHADGQGPQGAKQDTWRVLKDDLPEGMWLGWKNFYDEDKPMLTPEQTVAQVDPTPWFISYQ